jgi:hypothetical protein
MQKKSKLMSPYSWLRRKKNKCHEITLLQLLNPRASMHAKTVQNQLMTRLFGAFRFAVVAHLQGDSKGQLLPQGRPRLLHAPVRPRAGGPLADTRLPQHGGALRLRGRHVFLLRRRRPRPRRRQSHQYVTMPCTDLAISPCMYQQIMHLHDGREHVRDPGVRRWIQKTR